MDDVDARKCRDGRLEYLGVISFFFIAVPMTCILFNPMIGGLLIDAAIPAFYTGLMVAGVYLYSASLTVLLVIVFFAIFIMNYWAFVYMPASRAHYKRREKLKRIQSQFNDASTARSRQAASSRSLQSSTAISFMRYLSRVMNIVKRALQHGITLLSVRRKSRKKSRNFKALWRDKNRPPVQNGIIAGPSSRTGKDSDINVLQSPRIRPPRRRAKNNAILFPSSIISMSTAANAEILRGRTIFRNDSLGSYSGSVIYKTSGSEEDCLKRKIYPMLTFDAKQALTILRSSLSPKDDPMSDRGVYLSNIDERQRDIDRLQFEVTENNLSNEFWNLLDIFYPDGVALTVSEKEEACERFHAWKVSQGANFAVRASTSGAVQERYINFNLFEGWFKAEILSVVRNSLSDRLLNHPLNLPPKQRRSSSNFRIKNKLSSSWGEFYNEKSYSKL